MSGNHLNQSQLARRWHISIRTLEAWRWRDQGPNYLKIRGRVLYRLEDVEAFEAASVHRTSTAPQCAASIGPLVAIAQDRSHV